MIKHIFLLWKHQPTEGILTNTDHDCQTAGNGFAGSAWIELLASVCERFPEGRYLLLPGTGTGLSALWQNSSAGLPLFHPIRHQVILA